MKNKGILILALLVELLLQPLLPYSVLDNSLTISISIYLIFLIVSQKDLPILDNAYTCLIFTFIYCLLFQKAIWMIFIYLLLLIISKIWKQSILDSVFELSILVTTLVFLEKLMILGIRYIIYNGHLNIRAIFVYQIAPTLLLTFVFSLVALFIYQRYLDYVNIKKEIGKVHEQIFIFDYIKNRIKK